MSSKKNELFLRKEEESPSDDIEGKWDDKHLIKAYDKAVAKAKKEILKKIQKEDGLTNEEIKDLITEEDSECSAKLSKSKKKKNNKKNPLKLSKDSHWSVGDFCRAVYSEDGEEYEAQIVRKINGQWCVIKFIGYNNEEEVLLDELMPSSGKKFRKIQTEMAEDDLKTQLTFSDSDSVDSAAADVKDKNLLSEGECDSEPTRYPDFAGLHSTRSIYKPSLPPPPPPPPMPPSVLNGQYPMMGPYPALRDAANLDSLLMAWYTCGYYTGYYAREMNH